MQNQRLTFQGWKYADQAQRAAVKDQWNQQFKQMGMAVDLDKFAQTMDQKERIHQDLQDYRKLSAKIAVRGQDQNLETERMKLAAKIQDQIVDHQFDTEKQNADMLYHIQKAKADGKWPEGMDENKLLLEFQQGAQINPQELGMNRESFQQMLQGMRPQSQPLQPNVGGRLQQVQGAMGQPQSPYAQFSPMFGAPQTQQGGALGSPPAQFGQPQGGMQQAPARPQQGQAAAAMPALSKIGQQAYQRISQKYKPEEAQMLVIQRLMKPPYSLSYEQAAARVAGR
jgi:hypothetical protein